MNKFVIIDKLIEKIQIVICAALFAGILSLGTLQIFARYASEYLAEFIEPLSVPWTEELMRFMNIWLAMVGSSLTIRVDGHVSVDVLISYVKSNKAKACLFMVSRLLCVVFLLIFLPASIILMIKTKLSMATTVPLPFTYVYLGVPVGIVLMLLSYASAIPKYMKNYRQGVL